MDQVFLLGAIVCAIGLVILLFMPNIKLSNKSAAARIAESETTSDAGVRPHSWQEDLADAAAMESGGHTLNELADAGEGRTQERVG